MSKYDHKKIEKKWKKNWKDRQLYKTSESKDKPKYYVLDMFPYPSGVGLHVGHPKGYIATDILARMKMMQGYNVLHPMGWDAFGLPAENYAIKNKVHPSVSTKKNIKTFKKQLDLLGFTYDWSREVNTIDPQYYKWTQWAFLQMFKKGLAYESYEPINWCPECKTGLANEDLEGGLCERCGTPVEKKPLRQWVLKITDYAERLLSDLDKLKNWPESIKTMQREWIGRSEGALIDFLLPKFPEILVATNNKSKIERVKNLLKVAGLNIKVLAPADLGLKMEDVEENGSLMENAYKKALAYKGKIQMPILAVDTGFFIENETIDPIKVKRNALEGEDENKLSQEKIAEKLLNYYKKIAEAHGGEVPAFWRDTWVLLLSDGTTTTAESKRDVILTDQIRGEVNKYFPVRSLYKVKISGKYTFEQTPEEHNKEMKPVSDALVNLLADKLTVFTTRPDTLFGATYMVIAPEHKLVEKLKVRISNGAEVEEYVKKAKNKSDLERADLAKEKTGVELKGVKAINPATGEAMPIFVADYVITGYGTGAIMAVPAHDERDWEFAQKYELPIKEVVVKKFGERRDSAIRRDGVFGVVLNKDNNVLVLLHKQTGIYHLPGGGFESGEDSIDVVKREIEEETGYNDFEVEANLNKIEANYDTKNKGVIRHRISTAFIIKLNSESKGKMLEEDANRFEIIWCNYSEAMKKFSLNNESWGEEEFVRRAFEVKERCFSGEGTVINSGFLDDLSTAEAKTKIIAWLEEKGIGQKKVQFKLRDWVFSRQRYWGEPIPLVHCEKCGWVAVPEDQLPVELPKVKNYEPSGTGESPLINITDWVNTKCPQCGGAAKRETNTMPQWAGSCWYYLRYIDPQNNQELVDKDKEKYWSPVDFYVGGAEHATRHLIYARFWHKFLYDIGAVNYDEPFTRLQNVGLILAEDGRKMSKRWGNVINPDEVVKEYGADAMRLYEMFMGPFSQPCAWSTQGLIGTRRFLEKVWNLFAKAEKEKSNAEVEKILHQTIKKVTDDIENMRFNTAISQLMILVNDFSKKENVGKKDFSVFLQLLAPFAPHIAEELWNQLGNNESIFATFWPKYDPSLVKDNEITLAIQINGKLRDTLIVPADISEIEAKNKALNLDKIQKWLDNKTPKKIIYVKGKLISIVI